MTSGVHSGSDTARLHIRAWSESDPPLINDVIDVLSGISALIEMATENRAISKLERFERAIAEGEVEAVEVVTELAESEGGAGSLGTSTPNRPAYSAGGEEYYYEEVEGTGRLDVVVERVSYRSPFELYLALISLASITGIAAGIAAKVIKTFDQYHAMRRREYAAHSARSRARSAEARARLDEEIANYVIHELADGSGVQPRKRRNIVKALQVIQKIELEP